ncbi:MAG TPA: hypothetical protein VJZ52_01060 [Candidatus Paceibacterota bacterium]|nr:hypothetical protein [Candidatus Paceibacterota bacterium]
MPYYVHSNFFVVLQLDSSLQNRGFNERMGKMKVNFELVVALLALLLAAFLFGFSQSGSLTAEAQAAPLAGGHWYFLTSGFEGGQYLTVAGPFASEAQCHEFRGWATGKRAGTSSCWYSGAK